MMRNDAQLNAVCTAVCRRMGKPSLWRSSGPTELAFSWVEASPLSSGERVLLLLAFAIYNGSGGLSVGSLLATLSGNQLAFVGSLLVAIGNGAAGVDEWLRINAPITTKGAGHV
jgi:hypothetical protein